MATLCYDDDGYHNDGDDDDGYGDIDGYNDVYGDGDDDDGDVYGDCDIDNDGDDDDDDYVYFDGCTEGECVILNGERQGIQ